MADTRIKEKLDLEKKYFKRFKPNIAEILTKFLRFMSRKVGKGQCVFNVKKGVIRTDKPSRLFISIKDPFIKYLNHGTLLKDKQNYQRLVEELTGLLEAAAIENQLQFYIYEQPQEPKFNSQGSQEEDTLRQRQLSE